MKQDIQLAAMVLRDGRLWLLRRSPDANWELPGEPLDGDDVDAEMDRILQVFGVSAPAIEEDFVETIHLPREGGHLVYNIYAPTEWTGEPTAGPGIGSGWFAIDELESISMEATVRDAILAAFGLKQPADRTAEFLAALNRQSEAPFSLFGGDERRRRVEERIARDFREIAPGAEGARRAGKDAGLDERTRLLAAIATLVALGHHEMLGEHVADAIDVGATREDLVAIVRLASDYAGFPTAVAAWPRVEEALGAHAGISDGTSR